MKFWLGVTANAWFEFLSREQPDEINFWQPSGKAPFVGLQVGAPFLFKLKRPYNHVGGGGYFVKFSTFPLSMVWETFGRKNGAASRSTFEAMIRRLAPNPRAHDPEVGCTILTAPFFWARENWIKDPVGWTSNIVRGRYYDTRQPDGAQLWNQVELNSRYLRIAENSIIPDDSSARYGEPTLVQPRLGQGAFRLIVTDAYNRRCAITGERTLPVLEAAHILPFAEKGPHDVTNGLLLRSDFHKLFDLGLITVTPELHVEVSPKIREEWFNGKAYYRLHGQRMANLPVDISQQPNPEFLRWHNENRYRA